MKTSDLDDAVKALIMGLTTDGAHHKQYYLEQALLALTEESWLENARTEFQWEKGIPS
jgi:hypothetical protein